MKDWLLNSEKELKSSVKENQKDLEVVVRRRRNRFTSYGGGRVEAWATEQDMALFEHDPKLLKFASLNPNVCKLENQQSLSRL